MTHSYDRPQIRRFPDSDAELCRRVPVTRCDFERASTAYQNKKLADRGVPVGRAKLVDPPTRDLSTPTALANPSPRNIRDQVTEMVNPDNVTGEVPIAVPLRSNQGQAYSIADGADPIRKPQHRLPPTQR